VPIQLKTQLRRSLCTRFRTRFFERNLEVLVIFQSQELLNPQYLSFPRLQSLLTPSSNSEAPNVFPRTGRPICSCSQLFIRALFTRLAAPAVEGVVRIRAVRSERDLSIPCRQRDSKLLLTC
jgi:hypothetical protein